MPSAQPHQNGNRCESCHTLYPAEGYSLCNFCLMRDAAATEEIGPADVEEPRRDLAKEDRNATKVVEFGLGIAWLLLVAGAFAVVYGIGPDAAPVSDSTDRYFQLFTALSAAVMLALVRPVKTRMLRWLKRDEPKQVRGTQPPE